MKGGVGVFLEQKVLERVLIIAREQVLGAFIAGLLWCELTAISLGENSGRVSPVPRVLTN